MSTALPVLQPRHIFGLKTSVKGNIQFLSDEEIVYPAGGVLVVHNVNQGRQKFIRLTDKGRNVSEVLVSPNKKFIVVAENVTRPILTVYDAQTFKRKRQIQIPSERECSTNYYAAMAFTFDSRNLIAITGHPDWTLYCFRVEKGKMDSCTRALYSNNTGTVRCCATNTNDANLLALVGDGLIRILACTDLVWRQFGFCKADQWNLTSAAWLTQDRLMIGSDDGRFLVIESGDLKAVLLAEDLPIMNLKFENELITASQMNLKVATLSDPNEDYAIRSLTPFSRGLIFGYLSGQVHLYEMETPHRYIKRTVFQLPDHTVVRDYDLIASDPDHKPTPSDRMTCVQALTVNASQDRVLVTCRESQIYGATLWSSVNTGPSLPIEVGAVSGTGDAAPAAPIANPITPTVPLTEFGFLLHNGPIGSMATCAWKPLLLTAGKLDRTLRIWNYEREEVELTQKFQDDIYSVALHPTGLYALVGFTDKLRFLTVTINEFVLSREFPLRICKQCTFSRMGYLFSGANGNMIQVYSSISFEMLYVLKGHSGRITGMSWSKDDRKMASCGTDGAVYEWSVMDAKRISEIVMKQCSFTGVSITSDAKSIFVVSQDGILRELVASNIHRELVVVPSTVIAAGSTGLDAITLSQIDLMLFLTGNEGTIYNVKLPLMERAEFDEYQIHSQRVKFVLVSFDDRFLFTCSKDGSICVWRLFNTEGKAIKMDKEFEVSIDVLIPRHTLEEKLTKIFDLQSRLKEMDAEYAYQMRQNDAVHNLKMRDIHAGYCGAIEELKEKNERMDGEHSQEIANINDDIKRMKRSHEEFVRELETNYNEKLIFEYEKYQSLEEKLDRMRKDYEKRLEELRREKKRSEDAITADFQEQLAQRQVEYEELQERCQQKEITHELIKQQIEEDADLEIYELKSSHAKEMKEELDLNVKIRAENTTAKKKMLAYQKDVEDIKLKMSSLEVEHVKLKRTIMELERQIADLKKEISERDATIQDKEKRIYDLKSKNLELDKFRFILEFKITELKAMIEPREKKIEELSMQVNDLVRELANLQKVILNLDVQLHQTKEKLRASELEIRREIASNVTLKRCLKKIKIEIYQASRYVQDIPKLIRAVREMYHKFDTDQDFEVLQREDAESKNEFLRQRQFLERTVAILQQQLRKGDSSLVERYKLVEQNADLLVETNILRRSLKSELKENQKLTSFLGMSKNVLPKVAQEKIRKATASREEIHEEYRRVIEENNQAIAAIQEENNRLINEIIALNVDDKSTVGSSVVLI